MKKGNRIIKDVFIAGLDVIPDSVLNMEAVKRGLFTGAEMMGSIDCFQSDFNSMFFAIDQLKGQALEIELKKWELEFNNRYLNCPDRQLYEHLHQKLILFITDKIIRVQNNIPELKPLTIKEMAFLYGCTRQTITRKIKKFTDEGKFRKTGQGRDYSVNDLILLEELFGCSFSKK